jgi:SAM-dependent methyltransferase
MPWGDVRTSNRGRAVRPGPHAVIGPSAGEARGAGARGASADALGAWSELLALFGDPTRARLLHLLAEEELSVLELTEAMRLPQSRVSTHLGKLREARLVRDRRAGSAVFYSLCQPLEGRAAGLWELLRAGAGDPLLEQDAQRMRALVAARGRSWADSAAGQLERHYAPGRTWEAYLRGLLGLTELGSVLDVASGDGAIAELIAPRAARVVCLDRSARMVAAGRARLAHLPQVSFQLGDMQALPFAENQFDQVLHLNALGCASDPQRALAEAARVLRPGGRLALVTLAAHAHAAEAARYDHLQLGFEPGALRAALEAQGLQVSLCAVTGRERREPHFEIVTAHARRPGGER